MIRAILLHHVYPDPAARAAVIARVAAACRTDDTLPVVRDRGTLTVVLARAAVKKKREPPA